MLYIIIKHKRKYEKVLLKIVLSRVCGGQCYLHIVLLGALPYFTFIEIVVAIIILVIIIIILTLLYIYRDRRRHHNPRFFILGTVQSFVMHLYYHIYVAKFQHIPDKLE